MWTGCCWWLHQCNRYKGDSLGQTGSWVYLKNTGGRIRSWYALAALSVPVTSPFWVSVYWNEEKEKRCTKTDRQKMRWLDSITESLDVNLSKLGTRVKDRGAWSAVVHGIAKSWTQLSDWTTTKPTLLLRSNFTTRQLQIDPKERISSCFWNSFKFRDSWLDKHMKHFLKTRPF